MICRTSRQLLTVLSLTALLGTSPVFAKNHTPARANRPAAPATGLLGLLQTFIAKVQTSVTVGTTPTSPSPTDPTSPNNGAGIRIDPEGVRLSNPTTTTSGGH